MSRRSWRSVTVAHNDPSADQLVSRRQVFHKKRNMAGVGVPVCSAVLGEHSGLHTVSFGNYSGLKTVSKLQVEVSSFGMDVLGFKILPASELMFQACRIKIPAPRLPAFNVLPRGTSAEKVHLVGSAVAHELEGHEERLLFLALVQLVPFRPQHPPHRWVSPTL